LIELPAKEFQLLEILLVNCDQPVSLTTIRNSGWASEVSDVRRNLAAHVSRLRAELKQAGSSVCLEKLDDDCYVLRPTQANASPLQSTAVDPSKEE
jgi:DNA-binding response OmpR family regulator